MKGLLLSCVFLCGCTGIAVPKTIALEAGTGVKHEPGEPAVQTNTAIVRVLWELRK